MRIFNKQILTGFAFDAEILFIAKKHGHSIKELPVIWINDLNSKLHPIKDAVRMFNELIKIRINDFLGRYK